METILYFCFLLFIFAIVLGFPAAWIAAGAAVLAPSARKKNDARRVFFN